MKFIILYFFFFISALNILIAGENTKIAQLYISAADSFFRNNKIDQAEIFINKALVYDSSRSDPYFIRAMISLETDRNLNNAIALLKKAVLYRSWDIYNENQALFELGMLYTKIKDYNRAVSSFYVIEDEFIDNSDFINYYSLALLNSGFLNIASDVLTYAARKYPQNSIYKKRLLHLDSSYREELLMQILDENRIYDFEPDLIIEVLKIMNDFGVKRELLGILDNKEIVTPEVIIERAIVNRSISTGDIDLFIKHNGFENYRQLRNLYSLLTDETQKKYFLENLNKHAGIIKDDINSDGIHERITQLNNSFYEWHREDINQDGINDFFIDFQDGNPFFINIKDNTMIFFSDYPFLKTIIAFDDPATEIYTFPDKRAKFDVVNYSNILYPPSLENDIYSKVQEILKLAENYQKNTDMNRIETLRKYFKTDRITYFENIDSLSMIVTRGLVKDGKTLYAESDLLSVSTFQTREIYTDGELTKISYDGNNNGIFEFKIENNVKYWDFNEDGIYDSKEWIGEDGYRYTMYSTKLNGIFDLTVKYSGRHPIAIKRDETWIDVVYDSNMDIFWVGEKCDNFSPDLLDNKTAIIQCSGRDVLITRAGSMIFAEVIN